jgi:hypothetical protein
MCEGPEKQKKIVLAVKHKLEWQQNKPKIRHRVTSHI